MLHTASLVKHPGMKLSEVENRLLTSGLRFINGKTTRDLCNYISPLREFATALAGKHDTNHVSPMPHSIVDIGPLTQELAEHGTRPRRRLALLHTLRRVYTEYWHAGHMTPSSLSQVHGKRSRALVDTAAPTAVAAGSAVAHWLRTQFYNFLETLASVLATPEDAVSVPGPDKSDKSAADSSSVDHTAVQLAAMRTIGHFIAHASSSAQQEGERGSRLSFDVMQWLLRRVFAADPVGAADAADGARPRPVGLAPRAARSLWNALRAFRSEFIDEYDDVRLAALKATAAIVTDKARQHHASSRSGGSDAAPDSASRDAIAAAPLATVIRAAIDLLLSVTLPLTDSEWRAAPHELWARHEWIAVLPATYAAVDAADGGGSGARAVDEGGASVTSDEVVDSDEEVEVGGAHGSTRQAHHRDEGMAAMASAPAYGGANVGATKHPRSSAQPPALLLHEQQAALSAAWLAVLRATGNQENAPPDVTRRVLLALPTAVLPHMPGRTPLLLADYLTACVNSGVEGDNSSGGVIALLALQSLFILMQRHGLEYPKFYQAVYALLRPSVVAAKHRARFFKCLDHFLASAAVPAYTAAAFAKRAARLALTSPTPYALFALPFIANLVKRHPAITPIIHRTTASASHAEGANPWPASADPFDPITDDPAASRALESSLWEVIALTNHAYAPVCHLARGLTRDIARAEADVTAEAVSGATYASLLTTELERTVKRGGETVAADAPFAFSRSGVDLLSRSGPSSRGADAAQDGAAPADIVSAMDSCIDFFA